MNELLDWALRYAALGRAVLAVWWVDDDGTCGCGQPHTGAHAHNIGKHPIAELVPNGFRSATCDEETIRTWWTRYPRANIGWALGLGYVAVDVDPRNGGDESLAELEHGGLALSSTLTQTTGGGGRHHVYRVSEDVRLRQRPIARGIDIKVGGKGYIIVAPSVTRAPYAWTNWPVAPATADEWLVATVVNGRSAGTRTDEDGRGGYEFPDSIPEGTRDDTLTSFAGRMRYAGASEDEIYDALLSVNRRGSPPKELPELERIARSVGRYPTGAGLPPDTALAQEIARLRVRRQADRLVHREEAAELWTAPPVSVTAAELVAAEFPPVRYVVNPLACEGHNVLLAAQYKAGKTTLNLNLARSLADRVPFLGWCPVDHEGRVAIYDYELEPEEYQEALRLHGVRNLDGIVVRNLRGFRAPIDLEVVKENVIADLRDHDVSTWIIDPYRRAFGGEENSNTEAFQWTETIDEIKREAGVRTCFISAHTGRQQFEPGEEHVRGATRLDDWCDVRWILTRDASGRRFLRAEGRRRINVPEFTLLFDDATLTLSGQHGDRSDARISHGIERVVEAVAADPGINKRNLIGALRGNARRAEEAIAAAKAAARIHVVDGPNREQRHYVMGT